MMNQKINNRPYNFAAGPAALPESVLQRCQAEFLNWHDSGVSILELGHRTELFETLLADVEQRLRQTIAIPDNFKVLFLHGGARMQFASIPMNLLGKNQQADYVVTGHWSEVAYSEAQKYGEINLVASSEYENYFTIPNVDAWQINSKAAYRFLCSNETLVGVQFKSFPQLDDVPLVADMTSDFLSRQIDFNQFGVVFASTQKNLGTSGLCLVIIRDDLLQQQQKITPSVVDFTIQAELRSLYNTPNVFAIYILGLMLDWLAEQGGLTAVEDLNNQKAAALYNYIDESDFYFNKIDTHYRSTMNVSFNAHDSNLEEKFLAQAAEQGLINLKGHKVTGGMRASLYNQIGLDAVDKLINFMRQFKQNC